MAKKLSLTREQLVAQREKLFNNIVKMESAGLTDAADELRTLLAEMDANIASTETSSKSDTFAKLFNLDAIELNDEQKAFIGEGGIKLKLTNDGKLAWAGGTGGAGGTKTRSYDEFYYDGRSFTTAKACVVAVVEDLAANGKTHKISTGNSMVREARSIANKFGIEIEARVIGSGDVVSLLEDEGDDTPAESQD